MRPRLPRELLTAVIRHYLSLPDDEQIRIALDYLHGPYAPRTVKLAGEEYVVRVTREDRLFYRPEGQPAEELTYLVDTVALELVIAGGVDPAEYQVIIEAAAVLAAEKAAERRRAA